MLWAIVKMVQKERGLPRGHSKLNVTLNLLGNTRVLVPSWPCNVLYHKWTHSTEGHLERVFDNINIDWDGYTLSRQCHMMVSNIHIHIWAQNVHIRAQERCNRLPIAYDSRIHKYSHGIQIWEAYLSRSCYGFANVLCVHFYNFHYYIIISVPLYTMICGSVLSRCIMHSP